jgi:hypothetical protein
MLKIHTSDGQTHPICLADEKQAADWVERLRSSRFQASITGASLVIEHETKHRCSECGAKSMGQLGVQYSISRPPDFPDVTYEFEDIPSGDGSKGGERVVLYFGDSRLSLTGHKSQPSARIVIAKVGRRKFRP